MRRWQRQLGAVVAQAIDTLTQRVLRSQAVSRQEQAFLRGTIRGYGGLRQLREIALRHGLAPPACCLLGWAHQIRYPAQSWLA